MAIRRIEQLVDDITGHTIEEGAGETVRFSLDGRAYEVDLSTINARKLREALRPYIAAGRRVRHTAKRA